MNQPNTSNLFFSPIDQALYDARTIFVNGPVGSELAIKVNSQLLALESADSTRPIILWINSPGGEVNSGFAIFDMIQFIQSKVITVVAGMAASMGSVIALAAEKENRFALTHGKILIHQPLIGGTIHGPASDIEIHAKNIIKTKEHMHKLYAERTGTSIEKYQELMERDYWVDTDEALELGLISRVICNRKDLE